MTTKNPRLTITLQPTLAAQLRRLSELTGNSQSALISDLLDGSGEVFDRLIHVLEAAEVAKGSLKGSIADDMKDAQGKIESQFDLVLDLFDDVSRPILDEAEKISRRGTRTAATARSAGARTRAAPGVSTPMSNRGVRYDPIATKKIAQVQRPVSGKAAKRGVKVRGVGK